MLDYKVIRKETEKSQVLKNKNQTLVCFSPNVVYRTSGLIFTGFKEITINEHGKTVLLKSFNWLKSHLRIRASEIKCCLTNEIQTSLIIH